MSSYIEVRNVSKSFSCRAILQNISLSVEQGTTVGLVGANGSGKSVLFKIICGFEKQIRAAYMCVAGRLAKMVVTSPQTWVYLSIPLALSVFTVAFKI